MRKICRKVSQQVTVLNRLKKILPFELRTDIYRAFIALHCIFITERALRFVTCDKSTTYETLLKQLNLLSPLNQRIIKMTTGA